MKLSMSFSGTNTGKWNDRIFPGTVRDEKGWGEYFHLFVCREKGMSDFFSCGTLKHVECFVGGWVPGENKIVFGRARGLIESCT